MNYSSSSSSLDCGRSIQDRACSSFHRNITEVTSTLLLLLCLTSAAADFWNALPSVPCQGREEEEEEEEG